MSGRLVSLRLVFCFLICSVFVGCSLFPYGCTQRPLLFLPVADASQHTTQGSYVMNVIGQKGKTSFFLAYQLQPSVAKISVFALEGVELLSASYDGKELTSEGSLGDDFPVDAFFKALQLVLWPDAAVFDRYEQQQLLLISSEQFVVKSCNADFLRVSKGDGRATLHFLIYGLQISLLQSNTQGDVL